MHRETTRKIAMAIAVIAVVALVVAALVPPT